MRLAGLVLLSVSLCMFIAELAWSIPDHVAKHDRVRNEAHEIALKLMQAAVDPNVFPTLQYESDIIKRLTTMSDVVGGRIEDTAGEPLVNIGLPPNLTVLEAQRSKLDMLESVDKRYLDVFIQPENSQLAHPIVLRIDLDVTYGRLRDDLIMRGLEALAVTAFGCIGVFFSLYPILFKPLALIRKAVIRGVQEQDIANEFQIKWRRQDELGTLASAINKLLQAASNHYDEAMYTSFAISEKSAVATMAYRPTGGLSFANPAALTIFGMENLEALAAIDPRFLKIKAASSPTADPISIEEALADGPFADEGVIVTPDGAKQMICMGTTTYREDGSVRRYVAQFLDADTVVQRISRLETANERATERRSAAEQRAIGLRAVLESCTILMQDSMQADDKHAVVEVDHTLKAWAQAVARVGKTRRVLYNRLPALNGSPALIPMIFRQALTYLDFASAYRNSEFKVIGKSESGLVTFELTENVPEGAIEKSPRERSSEQEINLTLAAVMKLAQVCGGSMRNKSDGEIKLEIILPRIMQSFSEGDEGQAVA